MLKYKLIALAGVIIMGVSSFVACLATSATVSNIGSGFLLFSIGIMSYAFTKWQP